MLTKNVVEETELAGKIIVISNICVAEILLLDLQVFLYSICVCNSCGHAIVGKL